MVFGPSTLDLTLYPGLWSMYPRLHIKADMSNHVQLCPIMSGHVQRLLPGLLCGTQTGHDSVLARLQSLLNVIDRNGRKKVRLVDPESVQRRLIVFIFIIAFNLLQESAAYQELLPRLATPLFMIALTVAEIGGFGVLLYGFIRSAYSVP